MKHSRHFVMPALLVVSLGVATASVKIPPGETLGEMGPGGCPIASVEGTISEVDIDKRQIIFLPRKNPKPVAVVVGADTRYRVPGFKKKELKTDGLSKIPVDAAAKIKFCTQTGEITEVKVKKKKKQKSTT